MGVTGSCVVQLFGTTPCDFGTIAWWWLACSVFGLASRCLLPSLARGFPSRVYSFACCPVASTPARLPAAPPFRGGWRAGGVGRGRLGCARMLVLGFGWRLSMWLNGCSIRDAAGTYLLISHAVRHYGSNEYESLASPMAPSGLCLKA